MRPTTPYRAYNGKVPRIPRQRTSHRGVIARSIVLARAELRRNLVSAEGFEVGNHATQISSLLRQGLVEKRRVTMVYPEREQHRIVQGLPLKEGAIIGGFHA